MSRVKYRSVLGRQVMAGISIVLSSCLKETVISISSFSIEGQDLSCSCSTEGRMRARERMSMSGPLRGESQVINEGSTVSMRFI